MCVHKETRIHYYISSNYLGMEYIVISISLRMVNEYIDYCYYYQVESYISIPIQDTRHVEYQNPTIII